jgi:trk system potassium uptake protein TrkA
VAALINRRATPTWCRAGQIDIAISPAQTSIGTLLAHVRRGDVAAVHSLRRGAAEALELVVHGDASPPRWWAAASRQLPVIKGATIGAIVRRVQPKERPAFTEDPSRQRARIQGDHGRTTTR